MSTLTRWLVLALAIVVSAVTLIGATVAGTAPSDAAAATTAAPGYPYPDAPDCNEVTGSNCVADQWSFYQGQCTSWVAFRLNERNGVAFGNRYLGVHWSHAGNWVEAAKALGISVNTAPGNGSVAWFDYGHVEYVEAVNADGSIVLSGMNVDYHNAYRLRTVKPGASEWPDRFIHVKDIPASADSGGSVSTTTFTPWQRVLDDPSQTFEFGKMVYKGMTRVASEKYVWEKYGSFARGGDMLMTYSCPGCSSTTDYFRWATGVPAPGTYLIKVYIPGNYATANMTYSIYDGSKHVKSVAVDQATKYGWVTLATVSVTSGIVNIYLKDNWTLDRVGESLSGRMIGADALSVTRKS